MYISTNSQYTDTGSTFKYNSAKNGGAILFDRSTGYLTSTIFLENYAQYGGALLVQTESLLSIATGLNFTGNYATSDGGAFQATSSSTFYITNSMFDSNIADDSS